jgi:hypothetical protein
MICVFIDFLINSFVAQAYSNFLSGFKKDDVEAFTFFDKTKGLSKGINFHSTVLIILAEIHFPF